MNVTLKLSTSLSYSNMCQHIADQCDSIWNGIKVRQRHQHTSVFPNLQQEDFHAVKEALFRSNTRHYKLNHHLFWMVFQQDSL